MQERQDRRKAELDASRREARSAVGDEVLRDTEHTPLPSRSLLSLLWMGPFRVLVRTAPDTCRLDKPATWRVFPEFDVERLRPCPRRTDLLGGVSGAGQPPPAAGPDSVPEHEVQELLKFKMHYCRARLAWPPSSR